jgi:ATP-dependent helicase HrpB
MSPDDPLADATFVVAADLDGNRTQARIRLAAGLDAADVEASLADQVERRVALAWDRQRDELVERTEVRIGGMIVDESTRAPSPGPATIDALVDRVRSTKLAALDLDGASGLRARVAFLHTERPDAWPDWSDRALLDGLDEWIAPYLLHATGAADLRRLDVAMLLANQLDWDHQVELAEVAPAEWLTPTGRRASIDWSGEHPSVSVRVQDVFGTTVHPTVGALAVPLVVELLSPADRPIQVTRDLPGFWRGSWADVRKDLAGRYPKHQWPTDPSVAPPTRLKRDL